MLFWEKQDQIWAKIFCIPKNRHSRTPVMYGIAKQMHFYVYFIALWWQTDSFQPFKHRKAASFKSVFIPILTYGDESWAMTEKMLCQVQAAEIGFFRRVLGVTSW